MYDEISDSFPYPPPSCLDSAYERKAIWEGWKFDVRYLYPENVDYYNERNEIEHRS